AGPAQNPGLFGLFGQNPQASCLNGAVLSQFSPFEKGPVTLTSPYIYQISTFVTCSVLLMFLGVLPRENRKNAPAAFLLALGGIRWAIGHPFRRFQKKIQDLGHGCRTGARPQKGTLI